MKKFSSLRGRGPKQSRSNELAWILLILISLAVPVFAEDGAGSAAQVVREVHLKKDPSEDAPSLGRLPRGTILTLKGERRNGFAEVAVELEDGSVEGWIRIDALNRRARGEDVREEEPDSVRVEEEGEEEVRPRRRKINVPRDEGLLLRRDTTFFYGLQAGANYGILQSVSTDFYGLGLMGGAHIGFFLDRNVPVRLEAGYMQMSGIAADDTSISFGYFESTANLGYLIERFELFGALSFAYCLSVSDLPTDITIDQPKDLSSLFGGGGIGYHFPLGEVTDVTLRGRYMISLLRDPVAFQGFSFQVFFSFRG